MTISFIYCENQYNLTILFVLMVNQGKKRSYSEQKTPEHLFSGVFLFHPEFSVFLCFIRQIVG